MGVVIDTGVFIRWEREGAIIDFSRWSSLGEPCISVITESELKVGIHRANTEERRARRTLFVSTILSNVVVLLIDSKVADIHAGMVAALSQKGTTIGPHDHRLPYARITREHMMRGVECAPDQLKESCVWLSQRSFRVFRDFSQSVTTFLRYCQPLRVRLQACDFHHGR